MDTISVPQLARALGLDRGYVARLARLGTIPAHRMPSLKRGGRWRINRQDAVAYVLRCGLDPALVLP